MKGIDIQQMMKQAKKLQEKLAEQQEELAKKMFEASAGGGMVTAVVNGRHELVSLKIDPEVVDKNDIGMLEDLVIAAINEAMSKVLEAGRGLFGNMFRGGGMPDPGSMFG